jgi:D-threo-aldose 1-dehydrogenase
MGWMRPLGATGLQVSALCLGGGPLGSMPRLFGEETPQERGIATVLAALDSPICFIDTSNGYSDGESERRIGEALRRVGGVPEGFVVETKTDPKDGDYSGERARRSVEESMERLGLDRLPMVHLHDPETWEFDDIAGAGGAVQALVDLREQGVVGSIGLAGGDVRIMARYLALEVFDVLLVHNRWTLVDRSAAGVIAEARRQGMGVLNAAVYGGGILAHQQDEGSPTTYGYRPAPRPVLGAVSAMRAVCARYGTDLPTASLQFSIRDDTFASTIVGMSRPERIAPAVAAAQTPLPDDLFAELESLLPAEEFWLDSPL